MNNKEKLTKVVLDNLPALNPWADKSLDQVVSQWYMARRSLSCYRLSDHGKLAFELADIQGYDFTIKCDKEIYHGMLHKGILSKKIKCPYYLGFKTNRYDSAYITVYDSKIAMMITLYGNVLEYLNLK